MRLILETWRYVYLWLCLLYTVLYWTKLYEVAITWGKIGIPNSRLHRKYMVHFTFSCHKMVNFVICCNLFPSRGRKKRDDEKHSVNIVISQLKIAFFMNWRAKKENFMIKTGIANHNDTSICSRFHILKHEKLLFHISRKISCPRSITYAVLLQHRMFLPTDLLGESQIKLIIMDLLFIGSAISTGISCRGI